jgi:hypothetical protein
MMNARHVTRAVRLAALALVALVPLAGTGCGSKLRTTFIPNQPPTVHFTRAPINTVGQYFYAYTMNWTGYDPDGRLDHFVYRVDPQIDAEKTAETGHRMYVLDADHDGNVDVCQPCGDRSADTSWVPTTRNEAFLFFRSQDPDPHTNPRTSSNYHTFVIHAVDDKNLLSTYPLYRTFNSFTIAPQATLDEPRPTTVIGVQVTPTVRMTWHGQDADAQRERLAVALERPRRVAGRRERVADRRVPE